MENRRGSPGACSWGKWPIRCPAVGAPNCQPASNASAHTSSYNEPAVRSGRVEVELLAAAKGRRDVRDQLVLARILSEHVAVAKVGLPGIENRSEIQIYDIVRRQAP